MYVHFSWSKLNSYIIFLYTQTGNRTFIMVYSIMWNHFAKFLMHGEETFIILLSPVPVSHGTKPLVCAVM
jgi:hypothetical protein